MSDELIDKLVREMAEWELPFYFCPFKVNEPLLDKRIIPLCERMINETLCGIRFFTNGSPLTDKNIEALANLKPGRFAQLWVSLNEYRPDEYKALMQLDFEQTASRLDRLHEYGFPHPVMLSTVGFPNEDFRRYCYERWPKFESMAIRNTGWLGQVEAQDYPVPDTECSRWWDLSIMANGIVSMCCMDSEGRFALGDVKKETMLEVYSRARHNRVEKQRNFYPCNTCNY